VGGEVFAHVAQHARRTVNRPTIRGLAFGRRASYRSTLYFKIAVSRNCVRFLFEIARARRQAAVGGDVEEECAQGRPGPAPGEAPAWFKNEHDEAPASPLSEFTLEKLGELADELTRTRDGQFIVGRAAGR